MPTKPKSVRRPWVAKQTPQPWMQTAEEKQFGNDPFYHSPAWRKLRAWHIAREPLCRECKAKGKVTQGQVVDHIQPRSQGGASLDPDNLQTLCHKCHNRKRAKEKMNK